MKPRLSSEKQRAVELVESGTRRKDAEYEIPLLWKDGEPRLTNNRVAVDSVADDWRLLGNTFDVVASRFSGFWWGLANFLAGSCGKTYFMTH
jgi:hypothetical protein